MQLRTLGGLALDGSVLGRPKPLLLLVYLTLEGPKPRRFLADLFWPGAANPTNSIAVAVRQIRQAVPDALQDDEVRLWADLPCDALELERALRSRQPEKVFGLYRGAFLEGAEASEWGTELEEWVYARREFLAGGVRDLAVEQAESEAAAGHFELATGWAERALQVSGAPEPTPEFWVRLYPLLLAGLSPVAGQVRQQAAEWNLKLELTPEQARSRLRQTFVGRETEEQRLKNLSGGQWAWVRGGPGLGKTSLLHRLPGQALPARAGLPYATLEPLLGQAVQHAEESTLLRHLAALEGCWLLDNWEGADDESRALLIKVRRLGTRVRVIITSQEEPPFPVDLRLELQALTPATLSGHEGAFEATGGLPSLLGAWLRGEALETALDNRLATLSRETQQVYGALTLLDHPDLPLVRQALKLDAPALAAAMDELIQAGLIEPSGQVRGHATARRALHSKPTQHAALALALARVHTGAAALPLYQAARTLWEVADEPQLVAAYQAWADKALKRGFPLRAATALSDAPSHPSLLFLRARALERAGQYRDAFTALQPLPNTAEVAALKGALLLRLGQPEQSRQAAEKALEGNDEARAEALNTLANLDFQMGQYGSAEKLYRRAATLWLTLGDQVRWAGALNNRAMARSELGENAELAFQEAIQAAGENLVMRARATQNLGYVQERRGDLDGAVISYREAARLSEEAGAINTSAKAWNNLGALHHRAGQGAQAKVAYEQALELAQRVGEKILLGMVLANLAELTGDQEAFEEALRLIEKSGNQDILARYKAEYQAFIARSLGGSQA